jgi:hypothetical protein
VVYGDVNDDTNVTTADAQIILVTPRPRTLPELDPLPWEATRIIAANVDGLAGVNALDGLAGAQYAAGSISQFPVEQPGWTAPEATASAQVWPAAP